MTNLKKGATAVGGIVIGLVTLRALRKRRSKDEEVDAALEEVGEGVEEAEDGLKTASEHAIAAVEHASVAAKKTLEARRERSE
jgi:uncharacterized membrane-anchored protein YhcB (DUF1043 family)